MKTGTKIFLGLATIGVIGALAKAAPTAIKLKNALSNISFDVKFNRLKSFSKGTAKLVFDSAIKNLSGFDLSIENLFVMLESSKDGKSWENFGGSPKRIPLVKLLDNKTNITPIPIEIKTGKVVLSLFGKHKYRFVINYDFSGLQQQYIVEQDIQPALKSISKKMGLGSPQLTQSLLS